MKKITLNIATLIMLVVILLIGITILGGDKSHPPVHAQTSGCQNNATNCLTGWAWSSNIGWVSFNSDNSRASTPPDGNGNYEVDVDDAGNLSGYAWSSNIGWISFNSADLSVSPACPSSVGVSMEPTSGKVIGWARAIVAEGRNDGWDGCIELSGNNHSSPDQTGNGGVTYSNANGIFKGFAWGSDVVGWLQFNPSLRSATKCTGPECGITNLVINGTCDASPLSAATTTNVVYTVIAATGTAPYFFNNQAIPINNPYTFTLRENSNHNFEVPVKDSSGIPGSISCSFNYTGTPAGPNSCVLPAHATTTDPTNCTFTCLAPYRINAAKTACVRPGTVIEQ